MVLLKQQIKRCVVLCSNSYHHIPGSLFLEDKDSDCQCFVVDETPDTSFVVFSGTYSSKDVITDLMITLSKFEHVKDDRVKVHTGFLHQYNSIRDDLIYELRARNNKHIIFTGHSLGGALSTLACIDMMYNFNIYGSCVTFGSPRCGNPRFAKCFNRHVKRSYRFVNNEDPVTDVPFYFRFKHVDGLLLLLPDGTITDQPITKFFPRLSNLDEHFSAYYVEKIMSL